MGRAPLIVATVCTAPLLLAAGWFLGQRQAADGPVAAGAAEVTPTQAAIATGTTTETAAPTTASTSTASSNASAATTAAAIPELPLPAIDTPLQGVFDELLERARRGDARAACRLAADLQRCRRAGSRPRDGRFFEERAASENDERRRDSMIDFMARMEEERERSDALCEGVTAEQLDLAFPLQMQAANARPELRVWAALSPALDQRFFVNELDQWQQYRQNALPWLEQAAAQGDLAAVIAMARVHGDGRGFGPPTPPFREMDDARFLTYAALMQRYGIEVPPVQRAVEAARGRVDAAAVTAAEQRADELFRPEAMPESRRDAMRAAMERSFNPMPKAPDCD